MTFPLKPKNDISPNDVSPKGFSPNNPFHKEHSPEGFFP
jgi:hypothetical protein